MSSINSRISTILGKEKDWLAEDGGLIEHLGQAWTEQSIDMRIVLFSQEEPRHSAHINHAGESITLPLELVSIQECFAQILFYLDERGWFNRLHYRLTDPS